jgi:hypothetical protein
MSDPALKQNFGKERLRTINGFCDANMDVRGFMQWLANQSLDDQVFVICRLLQYGRKYMEEGAPERAFELANADEGTRATITGTIEYCLGELAGFDEEALASHIRETPEAVAALGPVAFFFYAINDNRKKFYPEFGPVSQKPVKRSKRLYVLWSIALTLLLAAGAFCWLVVVPVWQVRAAMRDFKVIARDGPDPAHRAKEQARRRNIVARLGGADAACSKFSFYLRLPAWAVSDNDREEAARTVGGCGAVAIPTLVSMTRDKNREVRRIATIELAGLDDPRVVQPLLAVLQDSSDETLRFTAVTGLMRFNERRVLSALKTASENDESSAVRRWAAHALKKIMSAESTKK